MLAHVCVTVCNLSYGVQSDPTVAAQLSPLSAALFVTCMSGGVCSDLMVFIYRDMICFAGPLRLMHVRRRKIENAPTVSGGGGRGRESVGDRLDGPMGR